VNPLVSIIIPAHNAGPWIGEAIRSCQAQSWPAVEVTVVDDGSTDDTLAIANSFKSDRLSVIAQPNRGSSAARNAGLQAARGEYVQFLDADDLLAPDKIERQMQLLLTLDRMTLASGAWARFDRDPATANFSPQPNWRDLSGVEFLQLNFEEFLMMHPAAWLAPRTLLERVGPWNETLSLNDDGEYFARVALAADRIVFCNNARSYYRSNLSNSLSRRKDARALTSLFCSVELTLQRLLAVDRSPRTQAAAAYAWKWTAFELYPIAPALSRAAEENCRKLGGSLRPFPGSGQFQWASRLLGWRLARRFFT
jgi:glycosyltransferase involved in cell wall biosynthesis